ncbi:MAG: DUF3185 family protein [Gammaproteobacteria bacterium]
MASAQRLPTQLISIVLIVVGIGLIYWGYDMSGSVGSQVTETITGSTPDDVMVRYIAGAASLAAGIYLYFKK